MGLIARLKRGILLCTVKDKKLVQFLEKDIGFIAPKGKFFRLSCVTLGDVHYIIAHLGSIIPKNVSHTSRPLSSLDASRLLESLCDYSDDGILIDHDFMDYLRSELEMPWVERDNKYRKIVGASSCCTRMP